MELMILNLPKTIFSGELKEMFNPFGVVLKCTVVMDSERDHSKGFGFVTMEDDASANAAIAKLHGSKVGSKTIRVKPSKKGAS